MKLLFALAAALVAAPAIAQTPNPAPGPVAGQPAASQGAQATGQIKAVDAKAGTVTIHHSPISALGWPAMTMTFKATPEALRGAKAGQTVSFTLKTPENQVVAIQPK
jgi:Cu(I)/Ag(I) efflux system protein CusF